MQGKAYKDDTQIHRIDIRKIYGTNKKVNILINKIERDTNRLIKCGECGESFLKDNMVWDVRNNTFICDRCW